MQSVRAIYSEKKSAAPDDFKPISQKQYRSLCGGRFAECGLDRFEAHSSLRFGTYGVAQDVQRLACRSNRRTFRVFARLLHRCVDAPGTFWMWTVRLHYYVGPVWAR